MEYQSQAPSAGRYALELSDISKVRRRQTRILVPWPRCFCSTGVAIRPAISLVSSRGTTHSTSSPRLWTIQFPIYTFTHKASAHALRGFDFRACLYSRLFFDAFDFL